MRRRSRRGGPLRSDPNLTPLLDVVLQLITFFMMLVHFSTRLEGESRGVRLPVAPAALPGAELAFDRLPVVVDQGGFLVVEDRQLDEAAAEAWWTEQVRLRQDALGLLSGRREPAELSTLVIVRADRDAPYGRVRSLLGRAQRHGFSRFTLVVLKEEPR